MFHFMCVHYTFSSVWVAGWPPFGGWLPAWLTICSHCILSILQYLFISCFSFKSGICLLIAPVPVHCFSITFYAAEALYRQVNESESCANLQSVKLLNYLRY